MKNFLYSISEDEYNKYLKNINIEEGNNSFSSYDGAIYNKDKTKLLTVPEGKENITILYKHQTVGLTGDGVVEGANLVKNKGEENEEQVHIDIDGFFLAIGHKPNTDLFAEYIERDAEGYIKVEGHSPCTNVPGVFAAGDCADPHYRQAIVAAASGCKAAMEAEKYLASME